MKEIMTFKLGDIASVQTGPFGSQLHNEDYVDAGTPIVTVEHLGAKSFSTQNLPKVSQQDCVRLSKYSLQEGDIVFSRVGSVDRCSYVSDAENGWLFSGRCLRVRAGELVYPEYLYYYFQKESVKQEIRNVAVGATMPSINTNLLSDLIVELPPYDHQIKVANILASIDEKIQINNRINHNLEEQAKALYKSWFVDFEPFKGGKFVDSELGMIPDGWTVVSIQELSERIASGGTPKSMDASLYNGPIKWFTTKELKDNYLFDSEKHISNVAVENSAAKLFPAGSVLMAIYASPTVGRLGILTSESTFNQAAVAIVPKQSVGSEYIFLLLLSERNNLNNLASGAAQQNLNVGIIKNYRVLSPPIDTLNLFSRIIKPVFKEMMKNSSENCQLVEMRDSLLPKLMKGETDC